MVAVARSAHLLVATGTQEERLAVRVDVAAQVETSVSTGLVEDWRRWTHHDSASHSDGPAQDVAPPVHFLKVAEAARVLVSSEAALKTETIEE